jgi:hypothetical protein
MKERVKKLVSSEQPLSPQKAGLARHSFGTMLDLYADTGKGCLPLQLAQQYINAVAMLLLLFRAH